MPRDDRCGREEALNKDEGIAEREGTKDYRQNERESILKMEFQIHLCLI